MRKLSALREAFEQYREDYDLGGQPAGLYDPIDYTMSSGGKRLRPLLTLLGAQLFRDRIDPAFPTALAVEIFHNFSLVHDDIMDEAPLRRGKPSVHSHFGLNAGILSGDAMLILAYQCLAEAGDAPTVSHLLRIFNQVALEVCEGQQYDVDFETREDVSIPDYIRMIELKTAALIGGSLEMGAVAVGAPVKQAGHLREFGRNIGIAFQLQDDILDTFGDPERFGKRVGGDIANNKKTFLILQAQQEAEGQDAQRLKQLMSSKPSEEEAKIDEVTTILRRLHIPEWAEEIKKEYQHQAFAALSLVETEEARQQPLIKLAEQLLLRQK
jgi:geranylgeranyl diphosphate synthase, type II